MASVFVISGPSGAGKGTVINLLLQRLPNVALAVSATTRAPRFGEQEGREYYFISRERFTEAVEAGEFLEWAEYSGNRYGTLRSEVESKLARGYDVLLEIELAGARAINAAMPEAKRLFIAPPSLGELERRLRGRGTESGEAIIRRLRIAERELAAAEEFDAVILNDNAVCASEQVAGIIENLRKDPRG